MAKNKVHPVDANRKRGANRGADRSNERYKRFNDGSGPGQGQGHAKFANGQGETSQTTDARRPFDKKKWRLKKYSKKYKLDEWEEHRKKNILKHYYRDVRNANGGGVDVDRIYREESERDGESTPAPEPKRINYVVHPDILERSADGAGKPRGRVSALRAAQAEYERLKREKRDRKRDVLRQKAERAEALAKYRAKKADAFKKLSRKTKRGQPVMKGRIEMMLQKVQASLETEV